MASVLKGTSAKLDDTLVDPPASVKDPLLGQLFSGRYYIERRLGGGSMGEVYLARHTLMHKWVAIKVLRKKSKRSSEAVARFEREAIAASRVDHPNVAAATDFGQLPDGSFFLVLEYVEGIGLREALRQYGALPPKRALHIAEQVCAALTRAQEEGIVHRDLKPENIMLTCRGDDPDFVKVFDFGIARVPMQSGDDEEPVALTRAGVVYGTPEYMAPEQGLGHPVDVRSDLYSLGVILYEMLTGARPFIAKTDVLLMCMHATRAVPPMTEAAPTLEIPAEVEAFVQRLLAKLPADRPVDAHAAHADLRKLATTCASSIESFSGELPAHATSVAPTRERSPVARGMRAFGSAVLGAFVVTFCVLLGVLQAPAEAPAQPVHAGRGDGAPPSEIRLPHEVALARFEACEIAAGHAMLDRYGLPFDTKENHRAIAAGCFSKAGERGTSATQEALAALTALAKFDAASAQTPGFLRAVERASLQERTMPAAFAFLELYPSEAVADVLYRLTFGPSGSPTVTRAELALRDPVMMRHASRALLVALALRDAGDVCTAFSHVEEARDHGDGRALVHLERLDAFAHRPARLRRNVTAEEKGCFRRGEDVGDAILAIRNRLARGD